MVIILNKISCELRENPPKLVAQKVNGQWFGVADKY